MSTENNRHKISIKEMMSARYGENQRLSGGCDPALAVRCVNGTFVGKTEEDVSVFLGIPFAQPPVGELRWKRPLPVQPDGGVYEAYFNGRSPIQTEWATERASYYPQGEDCLYLNIWCSRVCTDPKKPVMVFFHGGSYGWGGTADPLYDGKNFVSSHPDIVLVTVGYRTGLMGFVDLSYVKGGEDFPDAPNLGILDQIEALRWVKQNIDGFSGDPDNVTIFGESAGGGSVSLLPIIDEAKGLFRRVIAESGSVSLTFSKKECADYTRRLLKESGCRSMDELMALSEDELKKVNEALNSYNNFPQRDGRLIPLDPYAPYLDGTTVDVDMLIGTNANESNYWIGEVGGIVPFRFSIPVKFENDMRLLSPSDRKRVKKAMSYMKGQEIWRMTEFYNEVMFRLPAVRQAESHAKNGGRVYMYYWTQPSAIRYCGACHAVELSYVFQNPKETIYTGEPADPGLTETVGNMWANFARTGDPSVPDFDWIAYDEKRRTTAIIGRTPQIKCDPLKTQRELLSPLLRYMINASYASLDYNVPFVRKTLAIALGAAASFAAIGVLLFKASKN
ncbi:MAG: carboxylesterase/lipase family protein [Ruminococcus sp.]|nr:carboxylesterase/lipase family protein [Ruminococcus sp.]